MYIETQEKNSNKTMIPIRTITAIMTDYARPTRYWVQFSTPRTMLSDSLSRNLIDIQLNCSSAQMPGVSLGTAELRTKGPIRKMPNDVIYADMNLTFYNTSKYKERKYFEKWIGSVTDNDTKSFAYYEDYVSNIVIAQFDNAGIVVHSVRLNEAYPTSLGEISLGYDNNDQVETFSVTISYRNWEVIRASNPIFDLGRQFIAKGFNKFFTQ